MDENIMLSPVTYYSLMKIFIIEKTIFGFVGIWYMVKNTRIFILVSLSVMLFATCSREDKVVVFDREQTIRLLSLDSNKTWIRTARGVNGAFDTQVSCDLNTHTTFHAASDSLFFEIRTDPEICQTEELISNGIWDLEDDPNVIGRIGQVIIIQEGDTSYRDILEITSLFLKISYDSGSDKIEEQFEYFN